jgi:hypothetical protein
MQKTGKLRITLYNAEGRIVQRGFHEASGLIMIDIGSLRPGIYAIETIGHDQPMVKILMIE